MKIIRVVLPLALFLLAGCLVPGRHGPVLLAPPLPPVVVFDADPYYYQDGYHYFYDNDRWFYSNSRSGPRMALPRDRYPNEVRFKGRGNERGGEEKRGHEGREHEGRGRE
jgi:hypothetical protein